MDKHSFETVLLEEGWAADVTMSVAEGRIVSIETGVPPDATAIRHRGLAAPGLPNLHSHAFQRGMAGLGAVRGSEQDSFWTWREAMYGFLDRLTPDDVQTIATLAYAEMLEAGFTSVVEFHYLHHDPEGRPYANRAEMAERLAAAAAATGIGFTLLPVLYRHGGFGGAEPTHGQRRFINDFDEFLRLCEGSQAAIAGIADAALGVAPHSLRAVSPELLREAVAAFPRGPIHIHVAEQEKEVADCVAWSGRRPVDWLLDSFPVDERWCLIHATHMNPEEIDRLAASGAVAGLCPITEADLGDGVFPGVSFVEAGGRFGVGTDSNVLIDAAGELRQLEYSQRLRDRARNRLARPGGSTGRSLFDAARHGGAQASGRLIGALAPGRRADFVLLDEAHPALIEREGDAALDAWIFAARTSPVRETWVGGRQVVAGGRALGIETASSR